jgi:hypothetical protein
MQRPRNARDRRPKAQLLKTPGVELTGRAQAMRLLKLPHGLRGGLVPFPAGPLRIRTVLCERLLDFRNAFGSRGLLAAFLPFVSRRLSFAGTAVRRGTASLPSGRPGLHGTRKRKRTQPRCQQQRQGQVRCLLKVYAHRSGSCDVIVGCLTGLCPTDKPSASGRHPAGEEP